MSLQSEQAALSAKDKLRSEFSTLTDNFFNLIKASKVTEPGHSDVILSGTRSQRPAPPGHLLELYSSKMQTACFEILAISKELKFNALVNDFKEKGKESSSIQE